MRKTVLVFAMVTLGGAAEAADLPVKAPLPVQPLAAFDPWDVAVGAGIASNYLFRGVTQSNHAPSVSAYFEPRFNLTKDFQIYAGMGASSIAFPNRTGVELDGYFGIRPAFGPVTFDFGVWYYGYPGGTCFAGVAGFGAECASSALPNGNFIKKDVSFYEGYAKVAWTVNDTVILGGNAYYSPSFLNTGAEGTYASVTAKIAAPSSLFGTSGIGAYLSGEFGRQWLGTSDAFYGHIKLADYNTWNIGVGVTYKVFTLDVRYSDTNLSRADCNAFTGDHTARFDGSFSPVNLSGVGSRWCGATGIVKLSADLTAMTNLK